MCLLTTLSSKSLTSYLSGSYWLFVRLLSRTRYIRHHAHLVLAICETSLSYPLLLIHTLSYNLQITILYSLLSSSLRRAIVMPLLSYSLAVYSSHTSFRFVLILHAMCRRLLLSTLMHSPTAYYEYRTYRLLLISSH